MNEMTGWTTRTTARLAAVDHPTVLAGAWNLFDQTAAWAIGPGADHGDALAATGAYTLVLEARDLLDQPGYDDEPTKLALADGTALAELLDQAEQQLAAVADTTTPADAHAPARASLLAGRAARAVRNATGGPR
ncbi:hypothetical protein ACFVUY_43285 [Kitasatospora sp. NPDC058063]|uniref:hypothetical protein n=1 Tax=unclassified Kitasatospora TaxID=2633591 RepID=UPI0036DE93FB